MRYLTLLLMFFLSSCSTTVSSIEYFDEVELKNSEFSPSVNEVKFLKYRIIVDKKDTRKYFKDIKNIEIVKYNSRPIDYKIAVKLETKEFKNRTISFGKLIIWNNRMKFTEEIIPIIDGQVQKRELQKFFSQIRGYILEKRENRDGEIIFKINLGKRSGLKTGSTLNIYGYRNRVSHLSENKRLSSYKIGVATVSDIVETDWSWIYLKNSEIAENISKGDRVTIQIKNFGEYLEDGTSLMKNNVDILENSIRF